MAVNKVVASFDEAVADIPDGASIMIGGFGDPGGIPQNLILALSRQKAKDLTIIGNSPFLAKVFSPISFPYIDCEILLEQRRVKRVIASYPILTTYVPQRKKSLLEEMAVSGEVDVEIYPQGTLAEKIRAGGAGLGGFYTPTGVGTLLAKGKEVREIDGRLYILEKALRADYAFVCAYRADEIGNLVYHGTARSFNPIMATAAGITIAEVFEIVKRGELDPEAIVTPGIYVKRVVEIPK